MKIKAWRRISQIFFFIVIIFGGLFVSNIFNIQKPVLERGTEGEVNLVDAATPIRTCRYIEPKPTLFESCSLKYLFNLPLNRPSWQSLSVYLLIIIVLYFVLARFMCGWMCPLGFVSDILNIIRSKLKLNRITFPEWFRTILKHWRYSFLLFLVFASISIILPFAGSMYMNKDFNAVACQVCPARTIIPLFGGRMPTMPTFLTPITSFFSVLALIFLGIFICSLFVTRAWCRICPNGSLTSLFNRGSLIVKKKDVTKCTKCGICKRVCPFDNNHVYEEKKNTIINHPNCIMCFNCVDKCPENDCLKVGIFGKNIFSSMFKR